MTISARRYHSLLIRENGTWGIHFGDFDKEVVQQELVDLRDGGTKGKDLFIVTTGPLQADIDAKVASLNARAQG